MKNQKKNLDKFMNGVAQLLGEQWDAEYIRDIEILDNECAKYK